MAVLCSSLRKLTALVFALVFATFFSYIFVFSGLVVSLCSILLLLIWPLSRNAYRYITSGLAYTVLGQIVWLCTDYADFRIHLFCAKEALDRFGKESHIVTSSHRGDLDWVAGFVLGAHYGFLHSIRSLPKRSVLFVPGFGQLLWALEYPFLARNNYQKDKKTIAAISQVYKSYPFPIQVAIYCEGTRFTKTKYAKCLEYAKKNDLPLLKHHLTPRTKGFALLAEHLRAGANFKSVYDVGVAYPGRTDQVYTHLDLLLGRKIELFWYMRRIPIEELPASHDDLNDFCYQMFQHKDDAYDHFLQMGEFPAPRQPLPSFGYTLWRLRVIAVTWALLLTLLPMLLMYLTLAWQTISLVVGMFLLFNSVLLVVLLLYARGAQRKDRTARDSVTSGAGDSATVGTGDTGAGTAGDGVTSGAADSTTKSNGKAD